MKSRAYSFILASAAALGSLSSGMFFTSFNASVSKVLAAIDSPNNINSVYIAFLSAVIPFGAVIGALITSYSIDTFGRRKNMILADVLPLLGCMLSIVPSFFAMFFGRFLCGIACGINLVVVPLYISEIYSLSTDKKATAHSRVMFTMGVLLSFSLAYLLDISTSGAKGYWKALCLIPMLFCALRLIAFTCFVKFDTAAYYMANNEEEEAVNALKQLWLEEEISIAFQEQQNNTVNMSGVSGILDYKYAKQAKIIMILTFAAQFMGTNVLLFHSTMIFAGKRDQNLRDLTSLESQNFCLGVAMFTVTALASQFVDKVRRRLSLVYGTLVLTMLCFLIAGSEAVNFWIGEMTLVIIYGGLQALLFGLIMPAYYEDLVPMLGMSTIVLMEMLLSLITVSVTPFVGVKALFMTFGIIGAVCFVPVFKKVKETKNKTKEEVMKMFHTTKENGLLDEEVAQTDVTIY